MKAAEQVRVLQLMLHDTLVGHLVGSQGGRNALVFDEGFRKNPHRPTLSLTIHRDFPGADKLIGEPWVRNQRLHPILSNLLPEGALRELLAQALKIHVDNEFELFAHLGQDLPGALVATALEPDQIPAHVLDSYQNAAPISLASPLRQGHFSLAGVQMKFSMQEKDGRYRLAHSGCLGDWILKTPSTRHRDVPLNEYSAMTLAKHAGVNIPDIALVPLEKLDTLPQINLPAERFAFAIRRFDRHDGQRIHMEDFAQVLVKYPHEKYGSANYEQIGKVLYQYTGDGLGNVQQFARRLLVNILLANGDAHLKNWSLLYADTVTPELSPAYDMVTTSVYIPDESQFALNLGKTRQWYDVDSTHFEAWAGKADIPWKAIRLHLEDTMEKARSLWPDALSDLPMNQEHKAQLIAHWKRLQPDFCIEAGS
ncbi:HipA N-terminal domain protein [Desulfurispirillum indicum S5]|uniref:HipA N-terminal domain protein n=1 Tax=Desulfurispirillum indicum (strain ATCC BAA-1389 / DSM 22839 / S5) TaxID=653733 RepID=E6W744_DESIS|nr:type II toxin-antitoxin system HipA family toxin [Desulfurispirillum indicum]ADU65122.1 HipA N-terminal domain protein [Desulfurispirillum indicum S5]